MDSEKLKEEYLNIGANKNQETKKMDEKLYKPMSLAPKRDRLKIPKQRYINDGKPIIRLPPYERPPFKEPDLKPSQGLCSQCDQWRNGNGTENCLKCDKYQKYKKKTHTRDAISFKHLPQEFMEAYADTPKTKNLKEAINKLPLERSVPLMMQFFLGATLQEIADYHLITPQRVDKKNKLSIELIKESLRRG